jgi:NAD(P)-dependent dehydrogenase (short-subunit alcohol dehydrogenase family)
MATFGLFCGVPCLLLPAIPVACLGAMAAFGLWTPVDARCDRALHLPHAQILRRGHLRPAPVRRADGLQDRRHHATDGIAREISRMDRVAVITAGGSGMGAAAARKLAADGYRIAILSSSGKGEALATALGGVGITGSNQSAEDVQRLVDATVSRWGRIDVLVNSAGHGPRGPLLEITDQDWHLGMEVYFLSAVRPIRAVTPVMQAGGGGAIINITTFATFEPDPAFPTSGVFRAGLAAFTKLFADRYAGENIRMNNVLPGFIDSLPEKPEFRSRIPMGRYGKVDEIAGVISFLASDAAGYITGQNLRVDGGITRSV